MIKLAAIIGTCILVVTLLFFYYIGMFDRLELSRESRGPYHLVYREYQGPYKSVRYMMNTVYRYVRDTLHLSTGTGFAAFYDNPQKAPDHDLRSISGVVIDDSVAVEPPCNYGVFKRTDAVVGRVKLRGFFSYAIGGYRFYKRLGMIIEKDSLVHSGPVLELYDMAAKTIRYIAPVGRPDEPFPAFGGE